MMTKEDVASIELYCKEQKVSYKSRLEELRIDLTMLKYYTYAFTATPTSLLK